jgi:hypothetical protein
MALTKTAYGSIFCQILKAPFCAAGRALPGLPLGEQFCAEILFSV